MTTPWLNDLLDKKLLLVSGKGGTGKSTCAAALALLAARRGKRCLLLEIETTSSARTIFDVRKPGILPKRSASGVEVVSIDFQKGVEEVVHDVMKVPRVVRVMLRHPVISRFLRATPSALDFVTLFLATRFAQSTGKSGEPRYDLVVVDLPALGHARIMLSVGRTVRDLFRVGPMATRAAEFDDLVHDPTHTSLVLVTLPEEMPITETLESYAAFREDLAVPLGPIIMNCTQPRRLDPDEATLVERMAAAARDAGDEDGAQALRRAADWSRWAATRHQRLEELRERLDGERIVEVPLFAGAVAGIDLALRVAEALARGEKEVAP